MAELNSDVECTFRPQLVSRRPYSAINDNVSTVSKSTRGGREGPDVFSRLNQDASEKPVRKEIAKIERQERGKVDP